MVIAVGVCAAVVSGGESSAEFGWCGAVSAAHVEYLALATEHCWDDSCVAGDASELLGGDGGGGPDAVAECLFGDGDHDGERFAT